jgi:hypothetical protein
VLVPGAVAIILAITVLTDLPQHTSRSAEISGDRSVMSQVNADVGPCSYAVGESFTIYAGLTAHSLTHSELEQVPGLLRDDQLACSFTDDSIYQLSTLEVPGSAAGKDLGQMVSTVTLWASSDALSAIEQMQTLYSHPNSSTALARLRDDERLMNSDRSQALAQLNDADAVLRTRLPALKLTQAPVGG